MRVDPNRQTGRTKAQIEAAVADAKRGENVLFVVHDHAMAVYVIDLLLSVSVPSAVNRIGMRADFDRGSVTVFGARKRSDVVRKVRGSSGSVVVYDHSWLSLTR